MATDIAVTLPKITVAASSAFTVTMLRQYVTTTLPDAVLQTYLDAAMEAIDDVLGPVIVTERLSASRGDILMLSREAESITSVIEDARWSELALEADDYELSGSGQSLYRLPSGTNPRRSWHGRVDVTYVRADDVAERIRAAVALVRLDLSFQPGLSQQTIGTWSESYASGVPYAEQRQQILDSLADGGAFVL